MISNYEPSRFFVVFLLACVLTVSVFMRLYYVKSTVMINPIQRDSLAYISYGYNLAFHNTFSKEFPSANPSPDSFRSPGYPLFIALSFIVGGKNGYYKLLLYSQAVLGGLLPVLSYMVAILFLPFSMAISVSILVALSPHLISMSSCCLTEVLFGFTLLACVVLFLYSNKYNHRVLYILAAILGGYAYLVNETFLFLPYVLTLTFLLTEKKYLYKEERHNLIIFMMVFSLFPCMWMVRNMASLSPDAPKGESRAISTMSHGAYPDFIYKSKKYKYLPYREDPEQPAFGNSLKNFTKILWKRIKERPYDYFVWYSFKKPYYLWSWNILQGQGDIYIYPVKRSLYSISKLAQTTKNIMHVLHPFFILLSFAGIPLIFFQCRTKKTKNSLNTYYFALFFYIIFIYYTLLYVVFAPWPRYSIPLRPVFYICALWTFIHLSGWIKNHFIKLP